MNEYSSTGGNQLVNFVNVLMTSVGMAGAVVLLLLAFVTLATRKGRWLTLGLLLYISTLSFNGGHLDTSILITPLQQIRLYSEPFCLAMLAMLALAGLMAGTGFPRRRAVLAATFLFFVFELFFAVRLMAAGGMTRGGLGAAVFVLLFVALGVGLPRMIQSFDDVHAVVRCVAGVGVLFLVLTLVQLLVNRGAIVYGNRLYATTGNPQAAGMIIALLLPFLAFVAMRPGERVGWRVSSGVTAALLCLLLAWTGSRTGFVMALVGLALLFWRQLGKAFAALVLGGALVVAGLQFLDLGSDIASRLVSTTDTRSHVWQAAWDEFSHNPAMGYIPPGGFLGHESSYLSAAAAMGIFGLVPLLAAMTAVVLALAKVNRVRRALGPHAPLADLVTAGLVSLGVGAIFEAFLLGTFSHQVFIIYVYLGVLTFLLEPAAAFAATGADEADAFDDDPHARPDEFAEPPSFGRPAFADERARGGL